MDGWLKKFLVSPEELDINTEDEPVNEVKLNYELLHDAHLWTQITYAIHL